MNLNPQIERAVLETLAYSDIFNYPLRLEELARYLPMHLNGFDLRAALAQLEGRVERRDEYYFLADRQATVAIRQSRAGPARRALRRARFYGRLLSALPFVRMVGVTGSLAVLNCDDTADLDFMLVAQTGRLWLARACTLILNRMARLFGDSLCPNLILSERALEWKQQDLYSARELCQMIPLAGERVYLALRVANKWAESFLPNANQMPEGLRLSKPFALSIQRILEYPLHGRLGDRLEAWEMNRKIARFSRQAGFGTETVFNGDVCQGNFNHHGATTMQAFNRRLAALELGEVKISDRRLSVQAAAK